jgi:hypothetical protein
MSVHDKSKDLREDLREDLMLLSEIAEECTWIASLLGEQNRLRLSVRLECLGESRVHIGPDEAMSCLQDDIIDNAILLVPNKI